MPFRYEIGISRETSLNEGISIGKTENGGCYLVEPEKLYFHTMILGRTGTGKSNLIKNLCMPMLKNGTDNLIVIDFHGTLSSDLIRMNSKMDLIFISPENKPDKKSVKINVLKGSAESPVFLYILQKIFSTENALSGGTWGPRLQTMLTSVLREVIMKNPDSTLSDYIETITSRNSMKELYNSSTGSTRTIIGNMISRWDSWQEYSMSTINKIFPITSDTGIRKLISSHEESMDIVSLLNEGSKLVVIDVSKTKYSEQQGKIVSSILLNRIWADILKNGMRKKCILIIDEAQNLNASIIKELLSEGRKFNVFCMLASQYMLQYDREVRDAAISNCGNFYAFSLSEEDAKIICSIIPGQKHRKLAMNSILIGPIHNTTHFSTRGNNGISVSSVTPYLMENLNNSISVEDAIESSLQKYGGFIEEGNIDNTQQNRISNHNELQQRFISYLDGKGCKPEIEKVIGESRPDIIFYVQSTPIIAEVEISDTIRFERIIEKACIYSNSPLIFLCMKDMGMVLIEKFHNHDLMSRHLSRMSRNGKNTFFNFEKITIVEDRNGKYYFIRDGKCTRWTPEFSLTESSFRFKSELLGVLTVNVLREMELSRNHEYSYLDMNIGEKKKVALYDLIL